MEPDIAALADEIWVELAEATHVEPPIQIKMYYDKTVKREDPENNKVLVDFKKPSEIIVKENQMTPAKSNWSSSVKYCLHPISKLSVDKPICSCHLLILVTFQ